MRTFSQRQIPSREPRFVERSHAVTHKLNDDALANGGLPALSPFARDFSRIPARAHLAGTLQTKLTVNVPGDASEQEADAMADRVMRMSTGPSSLPIHNPSQTKPVPPLTPGVQGNPRGGAAVSPTLSETIMASQGGGRHLDSRTQAFMESRFGMDFSRIRIHTDADAVGMSRAVSAQAFTVGNHVFFNVGRYSPDSDSGKRLLAHELMHTLQQRGGIIQRQPQPPSPPTKSPTPLSTPGDVNEQIKIIGETQIPYGIWRQNFGPTARPEEQILLERKITATETLGELRDQGAVITLIAILNDNIFAIKRLDPASKSLIIIAAVEALGKIGGKQALSELTNLLNSAELPKRKMAAKAFKHMRGKEAAAELLARLGKEPDLDVKADIVSALGDIGQDLGVGPETKLVADELIKIVSSVKTNDLKWLLNHAISALGKLKDQRATDALMDAMKYWKNDDILLMNIMNALGMIGDSKAVDYIDTWLRLSTNGSVRHAAADALGKIGGQNAIAKLKKRLDSKEEKNATVIQAIKAALKSP